MTPLNNVGCVPKSLDILINFYQINFHVKRHTFCISLKHNIKYANEAISHYICVHKPLKLQFF